jgi:predicted enzyme related to lactoylglutathione lyase
MSNQNVAAVLYTINLESIARFYGQVAGMRVQRTDTDHVVLEKDGFRLIVHQIPEEYAANVRIESPPRIRESGAIKLSLPVVSISNARQTAAQLGGCVYDADHEWEYEGSSVCDGWDPDGNVFQLFQPALDVQEDRGRG